MAKDPVCGMNVNETTALKFTKEGQAFYFCSQYCLDKFAKEQNIDLKDNIGCVEHSHQAVWKNKVFIVSAILLVGYLLSFILPVLKPFAHTLVMYIQMVWWAVILGLLIGGIVNHFIPQVYFSHILSRREKRTIFRAVTLGFLMSFCNHGILALAIQLYKKGASVPAVVAFLLASPWANLPLTLLLVGFFGLVKGLYIIICAIMIAVTTGLIYQRLEKNNMIETNPHIVQVGENFSILKDMKERAGHYQLSVQQLKEDIKGIYQGIMSLAGMVLWWILLGVGIASLTAAYVPQDIFQNYMGPTILGMLVTLVVATILEVCSEGTAPLAFEIFRQTGALGNSFVFLMAGVVTDYTEIGLLWHNIGRKTALWLPVLTVPQVILWGILANMIF